MGSDGFVHGGGGVTYPTVHRRQEGGSRAVPSTGKRCGAFHDFILLCTSGEKGTRSLQGVLSTVIQLEVPLILMASCHLSKRCPLQTELINCRGQEA